MRVIIVIVVQMLLHGQLPCLDLYLCVTVYMIFMFQMRPFGKWPEIKKMAVLVYLDNEVLSINSLILRGKYVRTKFKSTFKFINY
jgi:hypothetical protein